jgi:hypothetical protein
VGFSTMLTIEEQARAQEASAINSASENNREGFMPSDP